MIDQSIGRDSNKRIVGGAVVLAALAVVHWGFCQTPQNLKSQYSLTTNWAYDSIQVKAYSSLFDSLTSFSQSQDAIVIIHTYKPPSSNVEKWRAALMGLLVFGISYNFAIGVCSAIHANFFWQLNPLSKNYNNFEEQLFWYWKAFYYFSIAQAVLSFVVAIPIMAYLLASMMGFVLWQQSKEGVRETFLQIKAN